jgi:intracellular septation protein A
VHNRNHGKGKDLGQGRYLGSAGSGPGITVPPALGGPESSSRRARRRRAINVDHPHFELPRLRDLAKRAAPQVVEATLVPLALFYSALYVLGPKGAIWTALAWNYMAIARRAVRREKVPGLLVLASVGLTARSIIALVSGNSMFVYFLQPSLATALVGGAFLLSVPMGRPLAEKLAHDFVPLPPSFLKRPKVRQLFVRISLLWALVSLVNAAGAIALLVNVPIATYLAAKTGLSWGLTLAAIALSSWWFRRGLRRHGPETPAALEPAAIPVPVA